jgi:hypothetical protein
MDDRRFDDVTRRFGRLLNRRAVLASAAAATVAGIASVDDAGAAARRTCRPLGASCLRNRDCCSATCETLRSAARTRRNRCSCPSGQVPCDGTCVELGNEEHCLACGDACGEGEACCGAGGCIELGTDTDCLSCGDSCDVDAAGNAREFCDGSDGCQTACGAVGTGYVTTDWPPRYFATNNWNAFSYTNPDGGSTVTTCVTSADCNACPAAIQDADTVAGCGCLKQECLAGNMFGDYYNYLPLQAPDSYFCAVFYNS